MSNLKPINTIAMILLVVGGLNWGLVGAFDFNLVDAIFGSMETVERIIYVLVGLSAILVAFGSMKGNNDSSSM